MTDLPLQLGDIVAVSVSGLKLVILATGLKHGDARTLPEGQNLANATAILPSAGPNDVGTLMVCGPSKVVPSISAFDAAEFNGPELCIDVNKVEVHFPKQP